MRSSISSLMGALLTLALCTGTVAYGQTRWLADTEHNQVWLELAARAPLCQSGTPVLTNRSIGPLRPEQSLRELEQVCPKLQYGWYWNEGEPTPAVLVRLGKVGLMVEFSEPTAAGTVYRITSGDSQLRTADGFGPGSSLAAMIKAWGKPGFGVGECVLYASFPKRPGLSFRVDVPSSWDCLDSGRVEHTGDAGLLPRDTRVREVLLFATEK